MIDAGPGWNLAPGVAVDLSAMLTANMSETQASAALTRALMVGYQYDELETLQSLLRQAHAQLNARAVEASIAHAERHLLRGSLRQAATTALMVLHKHPAHEGACRLRMQALAAMGDQAGALSAYEACRQAIAESLGASPDQKTRMLHLALLQANGKPLQDEPATAVDGVHKPTCSVGRSDLLKALGSLVRLRHSVWLEGDPGQGKSQLVKELCSQLRAVCLSCRPSDETRPESLIQRLIGAVELRACSTEDMAMVELLALNKGAHTDQQRVVDATIDALRRLGRDGLELLVIDDMQYIDTASSRVLSEICEWLNRDTRLGLPVLLLAARPRKQNDSPECERVRRAAQAGRAFELVLLQPLDLVSTARLVAAVNPPWPDAQLCVPHLHRLSGGNPFFMLEILRAARHCERPNDLDVEVRGIVEMIRARLTDVQADVGALAALLAVAQDDFDPRMPQSILHMQPPALLAAWRELIQVGLFNAQGFAHGLALLAAKAQLIGPQAQMLHCGIAAFLDEHGAVPQRVAVHFLASHQPQRAVKPACKAMRDLSRNGLIEQAVALGDLTVARVPQPADSDSGFDLLWLRHYLLVVLKRYDRMDESLRLLWSSVRTDEQRLISAYMSMRSLRQGKSLAQLADIGREAFESNLRASGWWHACAAAYARLLVMADEVVPASRVFDLLQQGRGPDACEPQFVSVQADLSMVACCLKRQEQASRHMAHFIEDLDSSGLFPDRIAGRLRAAELQSRQGLLTSAVVYATQALDLSKRRGTPVTLRIQALTALMRHCSAAADLVRAAPLPGLLSRAVDECDGVQSAVDLHACALSAAMTWHALGNNDQYQQQLVCATDYAQAAGLRNHSACLRALTALSALLDGELDGTAFLASRSDCLGADIEPDELQLGHLLDLTACMVLPASQALDLASAIRTRAQSAGQRHAELGAMTEMAVALTALEEHDLARQLIDEMVSDIDRLTAPSLCRADFARRVWHAMHGCAHRQAASWRCGWQTWRTVTASALPENLRPGFLRRHAWVSHEVGHAPALPPHGAT